MHYLKLKIYIYVLYVHMYEVCKLNNKTDFFHIFINISIIIEHCPLQNSCFGKTYHFIFLFYILEFQFWLQPFEYCQRGPKLHSLKCFFEFNSIWANKATGFSVSKSLKKWFIEITVWHGATPSSFIHQFIDFFHQKMPWF